MSKVYIKYSFIFDPSDTWTNKEQFDLDLAKFFLSKGWRAEIIFPQNENSGEVMVYLERMEDVPAVETTVAEVSDKPQKVINKMRTGRGFDGKFKKQNG